MEIKQTPMNFLLLFLMIAGSAVFTIAILDSSGVSPVSNIQDTKSNQWHVGDRVYVPEERLYGNICSDSNVCYDVGWEQTKPFSELIKINNSKYYDIKDFSVYPSPLMNEYEQRFNDLRTDFPTDDEIGYCNDVYGIGTYKGVANTCQTYTENATEKVYYNHQINALIVFEWKLQKILDNKSNLNITVKKTRESTQSFINITAINYTLLKGWMDYYQIKYNNKSLSEKDFDEIKHNVPFMMQYCAVYGYTGYDENGCYRLV